MASPIKDTFDASKQEIIKLFPEVLKDIGMRQVGCHERLGIVSIYRNDDVLLYAHIVESNHGSTSVSLAPGLAYLGDRDQAEVPKSAITKIFDNIGNTIKKHEKSGNNVERI